VWSSFPVVAYSLLEILLHENTVSVLSWKTAAIWSSVAPGPYSFEWKHDETMTHQFAHRTERFMVRQTQLITPPTRCARWIPGRYLLHLIINHVHATSQARDRDTLARVGTRNSHSIPHPSGLRRVSRASSVVFHALRDDRGGTWMFGHSTSIPHSCKEAKP
jgi:hypothetical protein